MMDIKETAIIMMTKDELEKFVSEVVKNIISTNIIDVKQEDFKTYNRKEVCEKLDISYPTLLKLEKRGRIRGRKSGRKFFYTIEDLNNFINQTTKPLN